MLGCELVGIGDVDRLGQDLAALHGELLRVRAVLATDHDHRVDLACQHDAVVLSRQGDRADRVDDPQVVGSSQAEGRELPRACSAGSSTGSGRRSSSCAGRAPRWSTTGRFARSGKRIFMNARTSASAAALGYAVADVRIDRRAVLVVRDLEAARLEIRHAVVDVAAVEVRPRRQVGRLRSA